MRNLGCSKSGLINRLKNCKAMEIEKQPLDELLKSYKIQLKVSLEALDDSEKFSVNSFRLRTQIACYRTFITELEEVIK